VSVTAKRVIIIFSITLNVGFLIMAAILTTHHPPRPRSHRSAKMRLEALERLDLPEAVETHIIAAMNEMEADNIDFKRRLHLAINTSIALLAKPEPVDEKRFLELNDKVVDLMTRQNQAIREHLLDIRQRLGDENGARFFTEILKQVEKRKQREP
jgi:hypothetical protein